MNLLVDLGNSRIKWHDGVPENTSHAEKYRGGTLGGKLNKLWGKLKTPSGIWVCNVAGDKVGETLAHWTLENWGLQPHFARTQVQALGVRNAYAQPTQLGVDRWVAMIAAHKLYRGAVCVVDCGTAMTLDVVAQDGEHLGGIIAPGISLMRDSLLRRTKGIVPTQGASASLLARSTADAVAAGTLYAGVATIDRVVTDVANELGGKLICVITGGDAATIAPLLSIHTQHDTDLVLKGLTLLAGESA